MLVIVIFSSLLLLGQSARVAQKDASLRVGRAVEAPSPEDINAYELLNKRRRCADAVSPIMVYSDNLKRARAKGMVEQGEEQGLSSHEVAAIVGWTGGDYRFINAIARGQEEAEFDSVEIALPGMKTSCRLTRDEVWPYVSIISFAITKLQVYEGGRIWRGHARPVDELTGMMITFEGFTSFSVSRDRALESIAQPNSGRSLQRTLFVVDKHQSGRYIARFSVRPWEGEVLFPRGSRFRVVSRVASPEDLPAVDEAMAALRGELGPEVMIDVVHLQEVDPDAPARQSKFAPVMPSGV